MRAARYMTRFRCIGGDCEATCCAGFAVPVDEANHVRLKLIGQTDPIARALAERAVVVTPKGPAYGELRFESGLCSMLDEGGLCRIHAHLGEEALFDVCATYPRYVNRVDQQLELYGTLSCPEVARRALLADDAFEPCEVADQRPRKLRNDFERSAPYYRPYTQVRDSLLRVLDAPGDLRARLFTLLWMSDKLRSVLHQACGPVPLADLEAALVGMSRPEVVAQLGDTLRELPKDDGLLRSVTSQVLGNPGVDAPAQRAEVPDWVRERLDTYLTRYAKNCVLTTPYMIFPNLFAYVSDLVLKVALLRAQLERRLDGFTGSDEELSRAVVEVVYRFVRELEHTDLVERVTEELAAQRMSSLAHAVCLL